MDRPEALRRVAEARVARFATVRPNGQPHMVPITFALVGDALVHMVDAKPKSTQQLQRTRNVEAGTEATVLVDYYTEGWEQLWWVRIDGPASVVSQGPEWEAARKALVAKYEQYVDEPPEGPAIVVTIDQVTWWEGTR